MELYINQITVHKNLKIYLVLCTVHVMGSSSARPKMWRVKFAHTLSEGIYIRSDVCPITHKVRALGKINL